MTYRTEEDKRRLADFTKRRAAKVDECGAYGADHSFREKQSDGRWYCEYCGVEALPEVANELEALRK